MLLKPLITEKTMKEAARSCYTFMVQREADKRSIAKTVKELYSVTVISVSTVTIPQKGRRFGRRAKLVSGSPTKKAIVKLAPGQTLSLFESGNQKDQVGGKQ